MILLHEFADWIVPVLWRMTWQATFLIALVLTVRATLDRRLAPAWRFALWGVVLARLLIPALPNSPLSLFRLLAFVSGIRSESTTAPPSRDGLNAVTDGASPQQGEVLARRGRVARHTEPTSDSNRATKQGGFAAPEIAWTELRVAGVAWLVGVLILSGRMALIVMRLHLRSRQWQSADDPRLLDAFDRCQATMGGGVRPVRLRVTHDELGPAAAGLWRPSILIPRSLLRTASTEELEHILLHELAHVRRGDVAAQWLMTAACIVHWFNPAVWIAARCMQADREIACDAAVLGRLGRARRTPYGETVLKLAARFAAPRPLPGLVGVFGTKRQLHERIAMIARYTPLGRGWAMASAGLLCVFAVAGLTDAAPPVSSEPPPTASTNAQSDAPATVQDRAPVKANVSVSGTIRDADRQPLRGASVRLFQVRMSQLGEESLDEIRKLETADDGRFLFKDLQAPYWDEQTHASLSYAFVATRPGLSSYIFKIFREQKADELDVILRPAGTLRGRVTNPRGEPVAGAVVYLGGLGSSEHPVPGVLHTTTDKHGRYEITDMAVWVPKNSKTVDPKKGLMETVTTCFFRVQHPDYGLKLGEYREIPAVVDVQLEPAGVIEGRVIDAVTGKPAVGARLAAQGIDEGGWQSVRTDQDGRYRLTSLVADRYNVWASSPGRTVVALDSFAIAAGETKQAPDLKLIEGGFITGRVIGATGRPVARTSDGWKIQIGLHGPSMPRSGAAVDSVWVADDGTYRIRVAPGKNFPYVMRANIADRDAGTGWQKPVVVREGETITVDFRLRPQSEVEGEAP